jgi:hypothetical protein
MCRQAGTPAVISARPLPASYLLALRTDAASLCECSRNLRLEATSVCAASREVRAAAARQSEQRQAEAAGRTHGATGRATS